MKRGTFIIVAVASVFAAGAVCADDTTRGQAADNPPAHHDADNTGRNQRDRDGNTLTPFDQGGSEADREITAAIRQAVVDSEQLSTTAHNVKIITRDGHVTLRGPVKSTDERTAIANAAARVSGVKGVDNQLEVERHP